MEDERAFTERYFNGTSEPEPGEYEDDASNDVAALTEQIAQLNQNIAQGQEQQTLNDFWNEEDPDGWTNSDHYELAEQMVEEKLAELNPPPNAFDAYSEWEAEYNATQDELAQQRENEVLAEAARQQDALLNAAMDQHDLRDPQTAAAILSHANNLIESGELDHIPVGPERAGEAVYRATAEAAPLAMAFRVNGGLMSDTTRSQMARMGKSPEHFGRGGSWRRSR